MDRIMTSALRRQHKRSFINVVFAFNRFESIVFILAYVRLVNFLLHESHY